MRISDWSSDVCSSDLRARLGLGDAGGGDRVAAQVIGGALLGAALVAALQRLHALEHLRHRLRVVADARHGADADAVGLGFVAAGSTDDRRVGKKYLSKFRSRRPPSPEPKPRTNYQYS